MPSARNKKHLIKENFLVIECAVREKGCAAECGALMHDYNALPEGEGMLDLLLDEPTGSGEVVEEENEKIAG